MTRRNRFSPLATALVLVFLASPAGAATFDFIYADHLLVTNYPAVAGFTLAGADIGLVVNKGSSSIDAAEFFGATPAAPGQVIALEVDYPPGFTGTVLFNFTMTMGGERVSYTLLVDFTLGSDFAIDWPSAARTHSAPLPTAARAITWGGLKQRYR